MRLCRIGPEGAPRAAFYFDTHVVPVAAAAVAHSQARGTSVRIPTRDDILPLLSDFGLHETVTWLAKTPHPPGAIPIAQADLLVPVPKPNKIFCLAGNYAEHRSEEHTSELQSLRHLVCRLLLEKKKNKDENSTKPKKSAATNRQQKRQTRGD